MNKKMKTLLIIPGLFLMGVLSGCNANALYKDLDGRISYQSPTFGIETDKFFSQLLVNQEAYILKKFQSVGVPATSVKAILEDDSGMIPYPVAYIVKIKGRDSVKLNVKEILKESKPTDKNIIFEKISATYGSGRK
jgi:hypothetical protein